MHTYGCLMCNIVTCSTHIYTYTCIYTYVYTYMCMHVYIYIYIHTYIQKSDVPCYSAHHLAHLRMHVLARALSCGLWLVVSLSCARVSYIYIHMHMYIHTHIYIYVYIRTHMYVIVHIYGFRSQCASGANLCCSMLKCVAESCTVLQSVAVFISQCTSGVNL